jgi:hypothetical protein
MTGWNEAFPYDVSRLATPESVPWRDIVEWCDQTYGDGNWDYFNSKFHFKTERDLMLFKLRWL